MIDSRDLKFLHPAFRPAARLYLDECAARDVPMLVTSTLRDNEMQNHLYALGRTIKSHVGPWTAKQPLGRTVTKAKAGISAHNYGLAMDAYPIVGGKPVFDDKSPLWKVCGEAAKIAQIEWFGAPGSPYPEMAHVQIPNWRSYLTVIL